MEIPLEEAQDLYSDCICSIEKTRYRVHVGDAVWEVDEFSGENAGLVIAEIELPEEEASLRNPIGWAQRSLLIPAILMPVSLSIRCRVGLNKPPRAEDARFVFP